MRSLYKIVHTACQTGWGGIEKRILNESMWMAEKGHQVIIVAPENTPLFDRAKGFGFRLYPMSFKRLGTLANYRSLIRIFENEQPHILNTHGPADSKIALPAAQKAEVPCRILSRHIGDPIRNSWSSRRLFKHISHYVFTPAGHTRSHLQKVFNLKDMKIFSIPSGIVEPESLVLRDEARKALAGELGLETSTRFIGAVVTGRVSGGRGLPPLLKAFKKIRADIPHHMAVLGTGGSVCPDRLRELSRRLGIEDRVHFSELFSDIDEDGWSFFRALDCKVLAARDEKGLPVEETSQTLFQAMYCSCPVIAPKTGVAAEIIDHEKTGLLHEPGRESQISKEILNTLNHEAAALERIHAAREKVKKHHTMDVTGRDVTRIYRLHQVRLEKELMPYPSS
ncbi:glycosyltransferase family 4 protein [Desulfospira joergensenii]|uniref:glycosyltransferase family 4 protein n=1 Tax=Desulfospira joergensenii TaxID=53329 RepID=UPI0003B6D9B8|nr:glycosyltransferase family 4 protein [Desulfospira joergensenii]